MNITLSTNKGLLSNLRRPFLSKMGHRTVQALPSGQPLGINRTLFAGHTVHYMHPIAPKEAKTTSDLISMFGIKQHASSFRKITIAVQNTFKKH